MKELNSYTFITQLLHTFTVIMHLIETNPETLLHLRCNSLGLCSACDFDATKDKQIHNESDVPGGTLVRFERQYTDFGHTEFGRPEQTLPCPGNI